jgi:hypothetical protein
MKFFDFWAAFFGGDIKVHMGLLYHYKKKMPQCTWGKKKVSTKIIPIFNFFDFRFWGCNSFSVYKKATWATFLFERTRRRKIAKQFSDGAGVSL